MVLFEKFQSLSIFKLSLFKLNKTNKEYENKTNFR